MVNKDELTEVEQAILDYAMGNPGVIRVLRDQAREKGFTTAKQVEDLVGWPLSQHSTEKIVEIWDRFRNG